MHSTCCCTALSHACSSRCVWVLVSGASYSPAFVFFYNAYFLLSNCTHTSTGVFGFGCRYLYVRCVCECWLVFVHSEIACKCTLFLQSCLMHAPANKWECICVRCVQCVACCLCVQCRMLLISSHRLMWECVPHAGWCENACRMLFISGLSDWCEKETPTKRRR